MRGCRRSEMGASERVDERVDADSMWWISIGVLMQADGGAEAPSPAKKREKASIKRQAGE